MTVSVQWCRYYRHDQYSGLHWRHFRSRRQRQGHVGGHCDKQWLWRIPWPGLQETSSSSAPWATSWPQIDTNAMANHQEYSWFWDQRHAFLVTGCTGNQGLHICCPASFLSFFLVWKVYNDLLISQILVHFIIVLAKPVIFRFGRMWWGCSGRSELSLPQMCCQSQIK